MKFLGYIARNARRNPVRSVLTVGSIAVSIFLTMVLLSFITINQEVRGSLKGFNRVIAMSSQGFAQPVPIALARQVADMKGVEEVSPLTWYGGKYNEEWMAFAQFGVDAGSIFKIYDEFKVPPDQLRAFQADRAGCVIGRKLSEERHLKVGDRIPLKGDIYPFDLDLTVRGVYDGPAQRDLRTCFFHWDYLEEGLKRDYRGRGAGNAGALIIKCRDAASMPAVCRAIDASTRNSDVPTRTQTEEAFLKMFEEMAGDFAWLIAGVGGSVVVSLLFVAGNAMAMALRERVTEVAVLKAIGYSPRLVLSLVLAEAVLIAVFGGVLGAFGAKVLFDVVDISRYASQFLPFFYVSTMTAAIGVGIAAAIGLVSGFLPALFAARVRVVDGLRKVV